MKDANIVNALREHADLVEALTGDSGWRHMRPQVDGSDFPTQWMPSELECSIFDAQVKEIIKLRAQNEQLREAAALVAKESAERAVILPCKVGDTLYEVTGRKTISEYRVKAIRVELFCVFIEWEIEKGFVWQSLTGITQNEIGKTVFLTREEAEAALEAMKDE